MKREELEQLAERIEAALAPKRRAPLSIRGAVLQYLCDIYPEGATLGQVREHLCSFYQFDGHEKTPGVALGRLKTDALVEHIGTRLWRSTSPNDQGEFPDSITISRSDGEAIVSALRSKDPAP